MQELLNHPAVQAGLAPFLVALITAGLFHRIKLAGLAIIAGFATTIYLASDFSIEPLTSSRKIILAGLCSALFAIPLIILKARWIGAFLALLGGVTAVWVVQGILQHQPVQTMLLWGAGCAAYVALLVWGMDMLRNDPARAGSAATALGIGTGGAALVGASALLGQYGLSIGSAAAALAFFYMVSNKPFPPGRIFTLPIALIAGLTGCLAVLSAKLPWYVLPVLAAIPIAAHLVPLPGKSMRINIPLLLLLTFAFTAAAIYLAWQSAGDVPY